MIVRLQPFVFTGTCVLLGVSKRVGRMSGAAVNTSFSEALTFLVTLAVFSFALAILAGLLTAASWRLESLGVFTHVFSKLIKLLWR